MRRLFRFSVLVLVGLVVLAAEGGYRSPSSVHVATREMKAGYPLHTWGGSPVPASNIFPIPDFAPIGTLYTIPPCYQGQAGVAECDQQVLEAINHAHSVEGILPISLPANYSTLPYDVQSFIITNLERVSRGLPPAVGVTTSYDAHAVTATQTHMDVEHYTSTSFYASDWYGGGNALMGDYGYMYEDGWGGGPNGKFAFYNYDCTSATASSCWGHMQFILWNAGVPLAFGAAVGPWADGQNNSSLVLGTTAPASASAYTYTWAQYLQSISPANQCSPSVGTAVGAAADPSGGGWVVGSGGTVATQDNAPCYGSLAGQTLNAPIVGIAATPDGKGYWLVASDGGVFSFGDAVFYGSMGGKPLNKPIVGIAATPDGKGYWLVASDGGIFTFGDAKFDGSMGGKSLNKPIVGMTADPATGGYWEVASDGGIFSFNAPFFGSMGGKYLAQPIVGMDALSNGQGYRFVASDGGVFDFGAAGFLGSMGGKSLSSPIVGMAGNGSGYWLVGGEGRVYGY